MSASVNRDPHIVAAGVVLDFFLPFRGLELKSAGAKNALAADVRKEMKSLRADAKADAKVEAKVEVKVKVEVADVKAEDAKGESASENKSIRRALADEDSDDELGHDENDALAMMLAAESRIRSVFDAFERNGTALVPSLRDQLVRDLEYQGYFRIDATRAQPRGERSDVVVLILSERGRYYSHGPDLRQLLGGIAGQARLDELIVLASDEFHSKKNVTSVVAALETQRGPDPEGLHPFVCARPLRQFAAFMPKCSAAALYVQATPDAQAAWLRTQLKQAADVKDLPATQAAPFWLGARAGQLLFELRYSDTAALCCDARIVR